eukprot:TRINITY_DN1335_c0_g1_i8.p1 TRINITY_DN1335_c0_g1~~TRINITY_DN1335_c0_g1_i8.p1  ORF type:complete len:471 (-),score=45.29 TRINITY_DN1335_c0_g1_i8:187-1599(-)
MEVPHRLRCPITDELMKDPVMLIESGNIYEKCAIQKWLSIVKTDPLTNAEIQRGDLAPVHLLRSECQEFEQKMRNPQNQLLSDNTQSPLVKKAAELDAATQIWKESTRQVRELQQQSQKIDDNLVESGKQFKKEFQKFQDVCSQLNSVNTELGKMCIDNIKTTSSSQIAQKLEMHKLVQHRIFDEGKAVEEFVYKLLEGKSRQQHHKQILDPVIQEKKKLQNDVELIRKQLQDLTTQLTGQEEPPKKETPQKISKPQFQPLQSQSTSGNPPNQQLQENSQNQNQMVKLKLQDFVNKLGTGCVTNACVEITENCERIVCTVKQPIKIRNLDVVIVPQQKAKQFTIIFEGKGNITIENSYFTGLSLQFNGISHTSGQIIQIIDTQLKNSPGDGLSFIECGLVRIQNTTVSACKKNCCSFTNSNGEMLNCKLQDHHLYGVDIKSSTVYHKNVTTNQRATKLVQGKKSEWIKTN